MKKQNNCIDCVIPCMGIRCKKCSNAYNNRKRSLRHNVDIDTIIVNMEDYVAQDVTGNRLSVKMKFPFHCVKCHSEYQASLIYERVKKYPWHCKSCAISLEWLNETYRQKHVEELQKVNSSLIARDRLSKLSCANWANPIIRERMTIGTRDRISSAKKGKETLHKNLLSGKTKFKVTHGKRVFVNNIWMRSTYEARFANVLSTLNLVWEYEPRCFSVLGDKTYTPDFYIPDLDLYVEVKGWWRDDAKEKFNSFMSTNPTLRCVLVHKHELELLEKKEITLEACIITQCR